MFFDSLTYTEVHNRPEFSQESIIGTSPELFLKKGGVEFSEEYLL